MIKIGICDDNDKDREKIKSLCDEFLHIINVEYEIAQFASGEEVIKYAEDVSNKRIDLLFLDFEMGNMNGIEVKEAIIRKNLIWRIVFVTSHEESMGQAFSQKTLAFLTKPVFSENISKAVNLVLDELKHDEIRVINDGNEKIRVRLENVMYLSADGNYTRIVLHTDSVYMKNSILITKSIGAIERELYSDDIIRVHKSYAVNVENIMKIGKEISLRDMDKRIPIGRNYKKAVMERYAKYSKEQILRRV